MGIDIRKEDEERDAAARSGARRPALPGGQEYDVKNDAVVVGVGAVPVGVPESGARVNLDVPPVEHVPDTDQGVRKIGPAVGVEMAGKMDDDACAVGCRKGG